MSLQQRVGIMKMDKVLTLLANEVAEIQEFIVKADSVFDIIYEKLKLLDGTIGNHEDRIGALEEVALILRTKIEPETLTIEAKERAVNLAREREEPEY